MIDTHCIRRKVRHAASGYFDANTLNRTAKILSDDITE
ncbi:MAG: hypothetical protein BROFUL_01296 [Candidatus Brocadia fulgida]|uniref:Uncharacterized protein n=1 Tax=Candidatus Brocadia fulgida TaxID=380242 RepID=A0A0M2UZV3_9BACT|nr:MAG: hypothetical protein BROFUL_01296 [Candidatus Brocadia fulgida]MBV6519522.1 hypothetical protein [Candidatus Brocadia fulgida]